MKVSLVISVYKNVEDLKVVLDALKFQTYKNYEIIISEDGEFDGMKKFIATYESQNRITHITQPDEGWRKNKALNNAIRSANTDYLIFIDGDCVLHHRFIENHVRRSGPKNVVAGKRIKLGQQYSALLRENINDLLGFEKRIHQELRAVKKDGAKFYEEGLFIDPDGLMSFIPKLRRMHQLKGCNMSFYKKAIEAINGFDEDYILPAIGEDIDLTWRFKGLGYRLVSVRNTAVQYHIYHKENWTDQTENQRMMHAKQEAKKFICDNGLVKKLAIAGN